MTVLSYSDLHYINECLRDENSLMVMVTIKRCKLVEREDPNYPDSPLVPRYSFISIKADVREAPMQEVAHSGGLLLLGDLTLFCQTPIRGPSAAADPGDPEGYADVLLINGQEYAVVGVPFTGRLVDPLVVGYTAYLRRRKTGGPKVVG